MSALLLRLAGPLQSWGYRSRFSDRDTGLEPTKSGVVGLLCCALGRTRSQSPTDLAALRMHVRVDRPGTLLKDFHTAGGGVFRGDRKYFAPTSSGAKGKNPVITNRHYLEDASFLVALEGNSDLIGLIAEKVADPVWPLALGRRSCPPAESILVQAEPNGQGAEAALRDHPLRLSRPHLPTRWHGGKARYEADLSPMRIRFVFECDEGDTAGEVRRDVPVAWPDQLRREYAVRYVREETHHLTPEVLE